MVPTHDNNKTDQSSKVLSISFQEGFLNEKVQVYCNDIEMYAQSGVTTDIRTGLAVTTEIPLEEGLNRIRITLSDRDLSKEFQIRSAGRYYIGASIVHDDLNLKFSDQPFGYL